MSFCPQTAFGILLTSVLLAICPAGACGQAAPSAPGEALVAPSTDPGPWVPSLRTIGQDAVDIVEAPFSLSRSQRWLTLGAAGVVASTAMVLDRPTYHRASVGDGAVSHTAHSLAVPGRWYDRMGPDRAILGTAGLLAASGLVLQRRDFTRTSVRVVEALVYTKLVTSFAKGAVSRSRPFAQSGALAAEPGAFTSEHAALSMPSGHTARAFAVASVLAHEFDRWYVSAPAYGIATSVAVERVQSGDHWLTDVMVGGVLGYLIGRSISPTPSEPDEVTYTPVLSTNRVGLSVQF